MKRVYVDMDGVLCDYATQYDYYKEQFPGINYPQSRYGFFSDMKPIGHMWGDKYASIVCLNTLFDSKRFDTWILTAPSKMNPMSYTEKRVWIEKWFGMKVVDKLIICPDKSLLKGDYLIDDNVEGYGQENFEGELIHYGSDKFKTWIHVMEYL